MEDCSHSHSHAGEHLPPSWTHPLPQCARVRRVDISKVLRTELRHEGMWLDGGWMQRLHTGGDSEWVKQL